MANMEPNPNFRFDEEPRLVVRTALYEDESATWRITVMGEPAAVDAFAEARPLRLEVAPLAPDDAAERAAAHRAQIAEQVAARGERAAQRPMMQEEQWQRPRDDVPQGEPAPDGAPQLAFLLSLEMEQLRVPTPYRVAFELDPCVRPQGVYIKLFSLLGNDSTANVTCTGTAGTVSFEMGGFVGGNVGAGQNARLAVGAPANSWWSARVAWVDGANACFSLDGDLVVT